MPEGNFAGSAANFPFSSLSRSAQQSSMTTYSYHILTTTKILTTYQDHRQTRTIRTQEHTRAREPLFSRTEKHWKNYIAPKKRSGRRWGNRIFRTVQHRKNYITLKRTESTIFYKSSPVFYVFSGDIILQNTWTSSFFCVKMSPKHLNLQHLFF